jgi:hypothetical protein
MERILAQNFPVRRDDRGRLYRLNLYIIWESHPCRERQRDVFPLKNLEHLLDRPPNHICFFDPAMCQTTRNVASNGSGSVGSDIGSAAPNFMTDGPGFACRVEKYATGVPGAVPDRPIAGEPPVASLSRRIEASSELSIVTSDQQLPTQVYQSNRLLNCATMPARHVKSTQRAIQTERRLPVRLALRDHLAAGQWQAEAIPTARSDAETAVPVWRLSGEVFGGGEIL